MFITISGLIGAGKSTLAEALSKKMNLKLYKEKVEDNPYLPLFYSDMDKWSIQMELYLLKERYKQQLEVISSGGVQDRSIYEDKIFVDMLSDSGKIHDLDKIMYYDYFDILMKNIQKPNLIIHLDVKPEIALERIKMRNRSCETGVSINYLVSLNSMYQKHIKLWSKELNVIVLNYNNFLDVNKIVDIISEYIQKNSGVKNIEI